MKVRGDFAANQRLILIATISVFIGAVCAFVAVLLLAMIRFFTNLFYFHQLSLIPRSPSGSPLGLLMILVPVLGGIIIGLMARYGSERIRGHGIPEALEAILFGKSIMSPKVAILKPLSSAISIGSGGPFGAEGPIIMTGGAFGSIIAQGFHLTAAERKTLLVAGAAAGMSATFASPMAAVLLAVELLLFEWKPRSLVPVALASAMAAALRSHLLGAGPLFPIPAHAAVEWPSLIAAAVVGLAAGAFSWLLSTSLYKLEDLFEHIPVHWMWRPAIGGLVVGIGGYFQPRALGVGYDVIGDLLQGHLVASFVLGLVAVKCVIWMVSLASGTSGGVLAPLLIMGCSLGALESHLLPAGSHSLWPLVSMAAVLGGMMRAPFTAVIFALELTHDIDALPPLLIASIALMHSLFW